MSRHWPSRMGCSGATSTILRRRSPEPASQRARCRRRPKDNSGQAMGPEGGLSSWAAGNAIRPEGCPRIALGASMVT
jgi:hypothetical protein